MNKNLSIKNLTAGLSDKEILRKISLTIEAGSIYVLMGPNGSGKSTFAQIIMGNPTYKVDPSSKILLEGKDITTMPPDARAREGIFLAFQNPIAVPGVSVGNLLKNAYQAKQSKPISVWDFNTKLVEKAKTLGIPQEFLGRAINDTFSGGEKKKIEILQALILKPKFAILDEIDTGLDVDALKVVAGAVLELKQMGTGVVIITHYQRILKYVKPDHVHILVNGMLVASGDHTLALEIEKNGYKKYQGGKS